MVFLNLCSAKAQIIGSIKLGADDFIKGKEKVEAPSSSNETPSLPKPSTINNALSNELSIIRQQYRLVYQKDTYGKNGKPYYGETYTLGIKVSNGMYVLREAIEPWWLDNDYARVNATNKYTTERFWSYSRPINGTEYKTVELECGTDFIYPANTDSTLYFHEDKQSDFGLSIDNKPGKKTGYMVWAYAEPNAQDSAMTINLRQTDFSIQAKSDSMLIAMSPTNAEKVVGGMYIVPKYERGGRIQLMLAGVAVRNGSRKWKLQLLAATDKSDKKMKPKNTGDDAEPTPIKKTKKKKK